MSSTTDARWSEAVALTVALWLFVLLIFLPVIIERHTGDSWGSVALDSATIFVSMLLAMPLFAIFKATVDRSHLMRALLLGGTVIVIAVTQTAFDFLFTGWVTDHLRQSWSALPRSMARSYGAALNYICVFSVNLALFQLVYAGRRDRTRERQLADAQSAAQTAQLAALRFQLNPHFLFNTLNAISSMIMTRRNEEAERMTDRLSSFLRNSLAFDPTELVSLDEELALIEEYLEIEAVRFGERLIVEIACPAEAGKAPVPGFLIQPLVENAIKYGVARSSLPVTIAIGASIERGFLVLTVGDYGVADAVPDTGHAQSAGAGVGLANVRKRLDVIYGPAATIETGHCPGGYLVTIRLPLTPQ